MEAAAAKKGKTISQDEKDKFIELFTEVIGAVSVFNSCHQPTQTVYLSVSAWWYGLPGAFMTQQQFRALIISQLCAKSTADLQSWIDPVPTNGCQIRARYQVRDVAYGCGLRMWPMDSSSLAFLLYDP